MCKIWLVEILINFSISFVGKNVTLCCLRNMFYCISDYIQSNVTNTSNINELFETSFKIVFYLLFIIRIRKIEYQSPLLEILFAVSMKFLLPLHRLFILCERFLFCFSSFIKYFYLSFWYLE